MAGRLLLLDFEQCVCAGRRNLRAGDSVEVCTFCGGLRKRPLVADMAEYPLYGSDFMWRNKTILRDRGHRREQFKRRLKNSRGGIDGYAAVSKEFKKRLKEHEFPAHKIAQMAGFPSSTLSNIITGSLLIKYGDRRVINIGKFLGLTPKECFSKAEHLNVLL